MAQLARNTDASVDTSTAFVGLQISGDLIAATDLDAVDACRIFTDGKVYRSDGDAADINARVDGFTPKAYKAGQAVTLYGPGVRFGYGTGMTPSTNLYLDTVAGRLNTVATVGGTVVIARVVSATDIVIMAKQ